MGFTAQEMTLLGDHLVRCSARAGRVRGLILRAEQTLADMVRIHDLSPLSAAVAGRLAMGSQLLAADLKQEEASLTVLLRSSGPIAGVTCVADARSRVRVTVREPHVPGAEAQGLVKLAPVVGEGTLTVIRDSGLKEPYVGTVPLVSGEIAEDLAAYLLQSEQVRSVLALSISMNREGIQTAGGMLIQMMPDATEEDFAFVEARARGGFPDLSFLLGEGFSPAQILDLFFGDPDMEYLSSQPIGYFCPCTKERMQRNLLALGRKELSELAEEPAGVELTCHFCGSVYAFSQEEIRSWLQQEPDSETNLGIGK